MSRSQKNSHSEIVNVKRNVEDKSNSKRSKTKEAKARGADGMLQVETHESKNSSLPPTIKRVRKVVTADGGFVDSVVVQHKSKSGSVIYSQLNFTSLMRGNWDELARLCFEHSLVEVVDQKLMKQLAQQIISAATGSAHIFADEGFHLVAHKGKVHECFLWRGKLHWTGKKPKFPFVIDSKIALLPDPTCNLEKWNAKIGRYVANNPYFLVTQSAAFCSLISRWLGLPSTVLWIVGGSSLGKSSGQKATLSLIQAGSRLSSATGTPNGLRAKCAAYKDCPALLEEARQASNPQSLIDLVFDVANRASRVVSNSEQAASVGKELTCGLIISNERSIEELANGKNISLDEGLYARFFEMAIDGPFGFFHKLPRGKTGGQFSDFLVRRSDKYYGAGWDSWVQAVAKNAKRIKVWKVEKFDEIYHSITKDVTISDPVTSRLMYGVTAWAFAGYVASKLGILPATPRQINDAFKLVVREYVERVNARSTPMGDQIVECIRGCIDANSGKFPDLVTIRDNDQSGIYGYRRQVNDETQFLFFPASFDKIVGAKFGKRAAVAHLRKAGFLIAKKGGDQLMVRLPGKRKQRKRFYAINGTICFDGEME
jgi:hypothetical protein